MDARGKEGGEYLLLAQQQLISVLALLALIAVAHVGLVVVIALAPLMLLFLLLPAMRSCTLIPFPVATG